MQATRAVMADLAAVFHWPLSELRDMEIKKLIEWRKLAIERVGASR